MFTLQAESGQARHGILKTRSGKFETPFFMPAATLGTGKCITTDDYNKIGIRNIICNSLVLSMQPGIDAIDDLHKFIDFDGCIFTDCGGFQMSRNIFEGKTRQGLHFISPYTKKKHIITPEKIMHIQASLKSDVAMALDDMAPYGASRQEYVAALKNTHRWQEASLNARDEKQQVFGIIQGGFEMDLRRISAHFINGLDFDGIAIGGVAIGEPSVEMYQVLKTCLPIVDKAKPRYVMGLGSPQDVLNAIAAGVDCFDSVYPTKNARNGLLFSRKGHIDIRRVKYAQDRGPIDADCGCFVCMHYSRAYLHHLKRIDEPAGKRLRSYHNLWFMQRMIEDVRVAIKEDRFASFVKEFLPKNNNI